MCLIRKKITALMKISAKRVAAVRSYRYLAR